MLILFLIAIFSGAGLLFLVQPMIAKQLLPMLGGSPAVWNTCMVFFQLALLAGYVYAHVLSKIESRRTQLIIHAVVIVASLTTLPIGLGDAAGPTPGQSPNAWLLLHLTTSVGGPFFVLASASPLIQRWFGATNHRWAADPYFLYAASNAGSMLALIGYPFLYEPNLTLSAQTETWSIGFAAFAILALACFFVSNRAARTRTETRTSAITEKSPPLDWRTRVRWIALAFIPSSLMLGVTQHITTDIATTPILWVGPLAIYLATFIIAFARLGRWIVAGAHWLVPLAVLAVGVLLIAAMQKPIWPQVWIHLSGLTVVGIACHGRLAAERPHASKLTEFYLLLSVGGALGGAFNALLAPMLFDWVAEYPITLVLACFLRRPRASTDRDTPRWRPIVWSAIAVTLVSALFTWRWELLGLVAVPNTFLGFSAAPVLGGMIPAIGCLVWYFHRAAFALTVVVLFVAPRLQSAEDVIFKARTFFGVHRVLRGVDPNGFGEWHHLWHGSTGHGSQFSAKPWSERPTRYYTVTGPAGDLMRVVGATSGPKSVAVVGLGTGTLAAYGKPGWRFTFYEIDPEVIRIARDPRLFTYCAESQAELKFIVGDARLRLAATTDRYDALLLDAFSSDAIPVHLITKEAVELYLERLKPGGLLAFHITNRHLDLQPVLASIAKDLGLLVAVRHDGDKKAQKTEWKEYSAWVVLARTHAQLGSIAPDRNWVWLKADPKRRTWTDDYSNVLGVIR
jgi:SAM-dependent methyltransferase